MYSLLIIIGIVISIFLVIAILMQASKGDGLSGTFGAGSAGFGQVFGTRRTADFIGKITWYLGGGLLFIALIVNLFFLPGETTMEERQSIIQSSAQPSVPIVPTLPSTVTETSENNSITSDIKSDSVK